MRPEPDFAGRAGGREDRPRKTLAPGAAIVAAALAVAIVLAWRWLIATAGGADASMCVMAVCIWTPGYLIDAFLMWALMMVAMMLPSAAPMILLYHRLARASAGALARTGLFALAYVGIWTLFSAAAATAQAALVAAGFVSEMALRIGDSRIAGATLLLAGFYQLSPLKRACLDTCRSPLSFLMRLWRPGMAGALRLGLAHGAYCLGCCWALMLLLFVGGVMSLAWIAGLALLVWLEKLAPRAFKAGLVIGAVLIGLGAMLVAAP